MSIWDAFGIVAGVCIAIFAIPQIIVLIKTKDTSNIKLSMYLIYIVGCYLYVIIGIINAVHEKNIMKGLQLIIADGVASIVVTTILVWKIKNIARAYKLHVTETQYCTSLKPPKEVS